MDIRIELFDFPTKEEMLPLFKGSPLSDYRLEPKLFQRKELKLMEQLDYQIQVIEMITHLNNRIVQLNLSYAYVKYYFNRGIPDDIWFAQSEEGGIRYLPHLKNEHWTNKIHFEHHTDTFFQRVFTALDLLAHILYLRFSLKRNVRNGKEEAIGFNRVIWKLKEQELELYEKLLKIKKSSMFKEAAKIRNDIIHNQPPYKVHTLYQTIDGIITAQTNYMTSAKLQGKMEGIIFSLKEIFETIRLHLETK